MLNSFKAADIFLLVGVEDKIRAFGNDDKETHKIVCAFVVLDKMFFFILLNYAGFYEIF